MSVAAVEARTTAPAPGARVRTLMRDSLLYGVGSTAIRAVSLVLLPLLTHTLTPSAYGLLDLDTSTMYFLAMVLTIGIDLAVWRLIFDADDAAGRRRLLMTALLTQTVIVIVITAALILSASLWVPRVTGQGGEVANLQLFLLAVPLSVLATTMAAMLRATHRVRAFNVMALVQFGAVVMATVLALTTHHRTVHAMILCTLAGYVVAFAGGALLLRNELRLEFSLGQARALLRYGVPLIPGNLALWVLPLSGRFVIAHMRGATAVAEFGLAAKFAAVPMLVLGAFQVAWGPFALSIMRRPGAPQLYARVLTLVLVGGAAMMAVLVVLTPPIIRVVATADYAEAAPLVAWLTLGTVCTGANYVTSIAAIIVKRPGVLTVSLLAGATMALGGALLTVPWAGPEGAAASSFAGLLAAAVLPWLLTRRDLHIPYSLRSAAGPVVLAAALSVAATHVSLATRSTDLAMRLLALAVYGSYLALWARKEGLVRAFHDWRGALTPLPAG